MTPENQIRIIFYQQGMASLERELGLLYQRMNFFLTGMAFLVAALAAMLTVNKNLDIEPVA